MVGRRPRSRVRAAVLLGGCVVVAACADSSGPASTSGPPSASATAASQQVTPAPTPTKAPLPTFGTVVETAAEAPPGAITLELSYGDSPRYSPDAITAPQGSIALFLTNTDKVSERHDFNLGPEAGKAQQVHVPSLGGQTSVVVTIANVPPGTYAFWCTIQDHYKVGMVGTLTVTP